MIQSSIGFTRKEVVAENGVVAGGHDLVAQVGVKIMQQGSTPRVGGSLIRGGIHRITHPRRCAARLGGYGTPRCEYGCRSQWRFWATHRGEH